ncbi:MAG: hypothetical protein GF355_01600 [Candidatus Eisenbacteria bacterium]|nr:hypothetical protein [Candidatus Eisenbacteria bacterium]
MEDYESLAGEGQGLIEAKGSRFHGWAFPLGGDEGLEEALASARARWTQANHHAFAYRLLDRDGGVRYRSADDGEPGGTAGRPILAVLESRGLLQAGVIVSRIFGGVKLGTGGLARAYGSAARAAVDAAGTRGVTLRRKSIVSCPIEHLGSVEAFLHRSGVAIHARAADAREARWTVAVSTVERDRLAVWLAEETGGRAEIVDEA